MPAEAAVTRRWLYIWIAIGTVIVLVVVGFLIAISNALRSIDAGLDRATPQVRGVRGDVQPLPTYIDRVNAALSAIHTHLRPLHRQASVTISHLRSIDLLLGNGEGALSDTEASLGGTSRTLGNTSRTLADASRTLQRTSTTLSGTEGDLTDVSSTLARVAGTLTTTLGLAADIDRVLVAAERPASLGTGGIWRRVRTLNAGPLSAIDTKVGDIRTALGAVDGHLESICEALPLRALSQLGGRQPPPQPGASARC